VYHKNINQPGSALSLASDCNLLFQETAFCVRESCMGVKGLQRFAQQHAFFKILNLSRKARKGVKLLT